MTHIPPLRGDVLKRLDIQKFFFYGKVFHDL